MIPITVKKIAFISLVMITLSAASCDPTAREFWGEVIHKCAEDDLTKDLLYAGPSNTLGPGTLMRKTENNQYRVRRMLDDLADDDQQRDLVEPGNEVGCKGVSKKSMRLGGDVNLTVDVLPVSGELGSDFNKAENVTVEVKALTWDTLLEGNMEDFIMRSESEYERDAALPERYIIGRALRVNGFSGTLKFDRSVAPELSAKYEGGPLGKIGTGDVEVSLSGEWISDQELQLQTDGAFYIAYELWKYNPDGFADADGDRLMKHPVEDNARILNSNSQ